MGANVCKYLGYLQLCFRLCIVVEFGLQYSKRYFARNWSTAATALSNRSLIPLITT